MKKTFDDIVRDNTPWIFNYIRGKTNSRETAEDLTQEVWLRAFRAYDSYTEDGRLRRWLMRIAQNTVRSYFSEPVIVSCISLDDSDDDTDPLLAYLADESSADPEEKLIRRELVSEILDVIGTLPEKHRTVMTYRFIYDLSVSETAQRMNIPEGSVKSASHYAIGKIKKELKIEESTKKGDHTMECREVYKYLFVYALGKLDEGKRAEIKKHLDGCAECRDMAEALEKLIPHLPKENEDSMVHFIIEFPAVQVSYTGHGFEINEHETINAMLKEKNGVIGDNENYMGFRFSKNLELLGQFINQGEEIDFFIYTKEGDDWRKYVKNTYIPRVYPYMWGYASFADLDETMCYGKTSNCFRKAVYSAIYQAVPKNHGKLRMKRGNGFIDCSTYTFAYSARYLVSSEAIHLKYTYE